MARYNYAAKIIFLLCTVLLVRGVPIGTFLGTCKEGQNCYWREADEQGSLSAAATGDHLSSRPPGTNYSFSPPLAIVEEQVGLVSLFTSKGNNQFLEIDITDVMSTPGNDKWLLVTAMYSRGAYLGSSMRTLHEPLESTSPDTMIAFKLTSDKSSVDVLMPWTSVRTSDNESKAAFNQGVDAPFLSTLPRLTSSNMNRVIIDGMNLLASGFFVTSMVSASGGVRLVKAGSYPSNIVITAEYAELGLKTVSYSMLLLPAKPMATRAADPRLGFFDTTYTDFGVHNTLSTETDSEAINRVVHNIWRYDLESLPDRQIKVYVEPTVPERWRKYFKEGIESWNTAFEAIGYTDAVRAVLPTDADWPADYASGDVRFNTIAWCIDVSSTYAMGVAKVDPRSGQIMKGDIIFTDGWVDSYMREADRATPTETRINGLRMEQLKPNRAANEQSISLDLLRQLPGPMIGFPGKPSLLQHGISSASKDLSAAELELLGSGIRDVTMHEFGHLLGLRHNFKGSLSTSLDCVQNRTCAEEAGLSSSVMDYLPMNLPAAGLDGVLPFSRTIGEYDKLAIRYGYAPPVNGSEDSPATRAMLQEFLRYAAERFEVCSDEEFSAGVDPLCDQHDMSSEPLRFYADKLQLYANSLRYLVNASVMPGASYRNYGDAVGSILSSMQAIGGKLTFWLGGLNVSHSYRELDGSRGAVAKRPIPAEQQLEALRIILDLARPHASGLIPVSPGDQYLVMTSAMGGVDSLDVKAQVSSMQSYLVSSGVLSKTRISQVYANEDARPAPGGSRGLGAGALLANLTGLVFFNGSQARRAVSASDANDWELQLITARALKDLQADASLPAPLAALVAQQMDELREAAGAALVDLRAGGGGASLAEAAAPGGGPLAEKHLQILGLSLQTTYYASELNTKSPAADRRLCPLFWFLFVATWIALW